MLESILDLVTCLIIETITNLKFLMRGEDAEQMTAKADSNRNRTEEIGVHIRGLHWREKTKTKMDAGWLSKTY